MNHPSPVYMAINNGENTSPYVPTFGLPASGADLYKILSVEYIKNPAPSWCFTDVDSAAALGRIIDGPITHGSDLAAAETALRAILFHEKVDVLIPTIKVNEGNFSRYERLDRGIRNEASFKAFQIANAFDFLPAVELVQVGEGKILTSTNPNCNFISDDYKNLNLQYNSTLNAVADFAHALPIQSGASTCFSNPALMKGIPHSAAGFIDKLHKQVDLSWNVKSTPSMGLNISLPPLLAIVLSRSNNREDIINTLKEVRQELCDSRVELATLNEMLDKCMDHRDIEYQSQRYEESFSCIVAESRLTNAQVNWRSLKKIYRWMLPAVQLTSMAVNPLTIGPVELAKLYRSTVSAVNKDERLVSRSIAASTVANLLKVPNIKETIDTLFTNEEKLLIQKELNK
ncbi:hypothetical protein MUS1_08775 [Marinomonas ushuaiensis DSM 15871]|uniref:Uncharacterized protein n=1 Tax=Marinomonas ushuaiensis DSM 15871 TaxID=1122207 RepID=X7E2P7_9GAMM|nr:hypothetical protein [Marinomonas ushuaiensis]ETX09438.1 hypothetical protein MUS1_08775 [Marinomonas ushuaiensis DSM 15871]